MSFTRVLCPRHVFKADFRRGTGSKTGGLGSVSDCTVAASCGNPSEGAAASAGPASAPISCSSRANRASSLHRRHPRPLRVSHAYAARRWVSNASVHVKAIGHLRYDPCILRLAHHRAGHSLTVTQRLAQLSEVYLPAARDSATSGWLPSWRFRVTRQSHGAINGSACARQEPQSCQRPQASCRGCPMGQ